MLESGLASSPLARSRVTSTDGALQARTAFVLLGSLWSRRITAVRDSVEVASQASAVRIAHVLRVRGGRTGRHKVLGVLRLRFFRLPPNLSHPPPASPRKAASRARRGYRSDVSVSGQRFRSLIRTAARSSEHPRTAPDPPRFSQKDERWLNTPSRA